MSRASVNEQRDSVDERPAQSIIHLARPIIIDMGGPDDFGKALPGPLLGGFDGNSTSIINALTDDEGVVFQLGAGDANAVDVFVVHEFGQATASFFGVRGGNYRAGRNNTGHAYAEKNIVITSQ